jgi:peroxygenase
MAPARTKEDCFNVTIKQVPVTGQRRPFIQKEGYEPLTHTGMPSIPPPVTNSHPPPPSCSPSPNSQSLTKFFGTARATIAASVESPHGTQKDNLAERYKDQTASSPLSLPKIEMAKVEK